MVEGVEGEEGGILSIRECKVYKQRTWQDQTRDLLAVPMDFFNTANKSHAFFKPSVHDKRFRQTRQHRCDDQVNVASHAMIVTETKTSL